MKARRVIERLRRDHEVEALDGGKESLNRRLTRYALQNQQMGAAQTYVGVTDARHVVGYYRRTNRSAPACVAGACASCEA